MYRSIQIVRRQWESLVHHQRQITWFGCRQLSLWQLQEAFVLLLVLLLRPLQAMALQRLRLLRAAVDSTVAAVAVLLVAAVVSMVALQLAVAADFTAVLLVAVAIAASNFRTGYQGGGQKCPPLFFYRMSSEVKGEAGSPAEL